ncbi:trifunctional transcriptional regulator/proline dehydrogenase/pyrroline-5-carboxylate dehydrogenase [Salmonella enterica subsp. arizonae]|uniref:Trifunctional transcriptional regulator/proline dehydrogenase/pyrroline-5-carboxylate dehydrogenase n=1 Tax=Salmonella enterica subsp. arizonae TaxID=59203 RepID=A0A379SXS4_SALER|nr:trifunctional transcriptional regulator/proline dehydrogenase/pyrroline-5-carboxylate dehydrogenase [Salmonella enterica subsp. arizonae]
MQKWQAKPVLEQPVADGEMTPVINPAEPKDIVGWGREATESEVDQALQNAVNQAPVWFATPPQERAAIFAAGSGIDGRPNAAVDWPVGA